MMFWGTPPPRPQNTPANWKTFSSVNMFVDYRCTYFDIGGQSITSANIAIYILYENFLIDGESISVDQIH